MRPATRRGFAAGLVVMILCSAVVGLPRLSVNPHYTAYLDAEAPSLLDHQRIVETFSRPDSLVIVLRGKNSFLQPEPFLLVDELSYELERLPSVQRVVSIARLGILGENITDGFEPIPSRSQLEEQGRASGLLLSEDESLAAIVVFVQVQDRTAGETVRLADGLEQRVLELIEPTGLEAYFSGTLALNAAYVTTVRNDLRKILPIAVGVMFLLLMVRLRSAPVALVLLGTGTLSVVGAFGLIGIARPQLAALHAFTPVIIVSLSVAAGVHVVCSYARYRSQGQASLPASVQAGRSNRLPMLLAGATTAIGFLGLLFSPSPPVQVMGTAVALGIGLATALNLSLLPALLAAIDPPTRDRLRWFDVPGFCSWIRCRRMPILLACAVLAVPATLLVAGNRVGDSALEYFGPDHRFSRHTQVVDQELNGINEVLYAVDGQRACHFLEASSVEDLQRFAAWLRAQPEVRAVTSVGDLGLIREAQRGNRLQDRLDRYRASLERNPADRTPGPLELELSETFSTALVSVYLESLDSAALVEFDQRVRLWAKRQLSDHVLSGGGAALLFAQLGERNIRGMLVSLGGALVLATLLVLVVFRSGRMAGAALCCNLLPILLAYAAWSTFDGRISLGAAVVLGMVLGILLDDTIYFLASFRQSALARVENPVLEAIRNVGPAMISTTIVLIGGLSAGMLSQFSPIWTMSLLSVGVIGLALFIDLVLLPALLVRPDEVPLPRSIKP